MTKRPSSKVSFDQDVEETVQQLIQEAPAQGFWPGVPSFYSQDTRCVLIAGEITEDVANTVIAQLQQLQLDDPKALIRVYVNTVGGDADSAFALYDWMRCLSNPIVGIAYGRCSSAGLPILMGADYRCATPRCRFFYHECVAGFAASSIVELESATENYVWHQEQMQNILKERAKINKTNWRKYFVGKTSFFFDVEFALSMKIIHAVIPELKKKVTFPKD